MNRYFKQQQIVMALVAIVIILSITAVVLLNREPASWNCQAGQWVAQGKPKVPKPINGCQDGASISNSDEFADNEQKPKGTPVGVFILKPSLNQIITSPVTIQGSANSQYWQDDKLSLSIVNEALQVLGTGQASAGPADKLGNLSFETALEFKTTASSSQAGFIVINDEFRFPVNF